MALYLAFDATVYADHRIVTLREPFAQKDFTGVERILAIADTVHDLAGLHSRDLDGIGTQAEGTPDLAYGNGAYLLLTDDEVTYLLRLRDDRSNAASVAKQAKTDAIAVLDAIPTPAVAELKAAQAVSDKHWAGINEGGEGFVPTIGWDSKTGRAIADRHGLDHQAITSALRMLNGAS
jgi:hypothetical protein